MSYCAQPAQKPSSAGALVFAFALGTVLNLNFASLLRAQVALLRDTIVDTRGTTLSSRAPFGRTINGLPFQGQALTSFKGYQYSIYWVTDAATAPAAHVAIARRKLPDGAWQVIDLRDSPLKNGVRHGTNEPEDAHNVCSLGICPQDGTIHIAYDEHVHHLRYRVTAPDAASEPGKAQWDRTLFSPEVAELVDGQQIPSVSYPDFERTPEGNLQLFFREGGSGHGSWWLWNYAGASHKWIGGWQYDDGLHGLYDKTTPPAPTRCSYPNGWTYGPDGKLHITFTWREGHTGGNGSNHDINYVYSEDQGSTWKNNAGQVVGDHQTGEPSPFYSVASPGLAVVPTTQWDSLMNEQGQAVDSAGNIHAVMYHLDPARGTPGQSTPWQTQFCSYFHYWRDATGKWSQSIIPADVGTRPQIYFDGADNAYVIFGNAAVAPAKPKIYQDRQKLNIAMATRAANWGDWKIVLTEPGPFVSEALGDKALMQSDGILSIFAQETPAAEREPTKIHVLDFSTPGLHGTSGLREGQAAR